MMTKRRSLRCIVFLMILYIVAAMSLLLSIDKAAALMTIIIPVSFSF